MEQGIFEAGKRRLEGDTIREANSNEVTELRKENEQLKQLVAGQKRVGLNEKSTYKNLQVLDFPGGP